MALTVRLRLIERLYESPIRSDVEPLNF